MNNTSSRIKKVFLHNLIERIKELSAVEPGKDTDNIWYRHIHSMVGTAGTVGFSAVSEKLLPWEEKLARYKDSGAQLSNEDIKELKNILVYLTDFVRENDDSVSETEEN
jgi:chemotaxis protein histidine kinase CheA